MTVPTANPARSVEPGLHAARWWLRLALLLALGSVAGWWLPAAWLDWQPALAGQELWRAWTGAFVHWSAMHFGANLAGLAVVAALGVAAAVPLRIALAWSVAWPLTQAGLLLRPDLAHYGGLSGVLHAGVAAAAVWLLAGGGEHRQRQPGPQRWIGMALLAGLALKLVLEEPWGATLRHGHGWDIAVAPLAHATGAGAGLLCATLALLWRPARPPQLSLPARPAQPASAQRHDETRV